ncbi:MAG: SPASM domain-containing protein [Atribacterota bacterium]
MIQKEKYIYYDRFKNKWTRHGHNLLDSLRSIKNLRIFYVNLFTIFTRAGVTFYTRLPPTLQIEPTNFCNLNCHYCPTQKQSSRKKGYMKFDLFQKIVNEASEIGVAKVDLYLHGESLLHPQFVEMLRYIKSKNLSVNIDTNGMLFTSKKIKDILHSGLDRTDSFTFSLYGYSKQVNERLMDGVNHEKVIKNIHDFLKLRKKYEMCGPVIRTIFYTVPENKDEKEKFVEYWREIVDIVIVSRISKSFSEYKGEKITTPLRKKNCWILWNRMTIFWNGDVTFCGCDVDGDYVLGNLKEQSIKEIWNSKKLLAIKKIHKKKQFQKIPLCARCDE